MSAVCVFTPMLVELAWPMVAAALSTALTSLGYDAVAAAKASTLGTATSGQAQRTVDLAVKQSGSFEESLGEEETLTLQRDDVTLSFSKGADGRLKAQACSSTRSDAELKALGTEALDKFMQAYVRQKIVAELKKKGYTLEEEKLPDGTVHLKARKWA